MNHDLYSKRELDLIFTEIKEALKRIENHNRESFMRIETQTTKHNGRMSSLEKWRAYITGAISVIILIGLPIVAWLVKIHLSSLN